MMSTLNNIIEAQASEGAMTEIKRTGAPPHPGQHIREILDDVGASVRAAAAAMGVSHNALANVVRGDAGITPDMAVRLGIYMGNGPTGDEFWLRLQMEHDLWHARKRLKAAAAKIKPAPRQSKAA